MEFSRWILLEFSVLSYSTVQPFICVFGLCLTLSLLCNIQPFYWACPIDSGSRRRANRLEKRSVSSQTHLSPSLSLLREKKSFACTGSSDPSSFLFTSFPIFRTPFNTTLTREGSVTELSATLMGISVLLSVPLTLPVDWNCCHSKSIRNGS